MEELFNYVNIPVDKRWGGSPGLVVMGRDSCSKGREFESWQCILEENFSHSFLIKIVMCV